MGHAWEDKRHLSLAACFLTATLSIALSPAWLFHPPKADWCPVDAKGRVIPTTTADGVLQHAGEMFFIQRPSDKFTFLPISWPAARGPHDETWHRSKRLMSTAVRHTGEVVHVEICGRTVLRIEAQGSDVFAVKLRTQHDLDAEFTARNFPRRLGSLLCFAAFLCSITVWLMGRGKRDQATDLIRNGK